MTGTPTTQTHVPRLLADNPEIQRNLWLEVTSLRLILVPAFIFLPCAVIQGVNGTGALNLVLSFITWLLLILWGTRLAAESYSDEINGRTWDSQRLSTVKALPLTLGKLIGSTAIVWYGAAFALIALVVMFPDHVVDAARLIVEGLLAQTAALFAIVVQARAGRTVKGTGIALAQLFGIFLGGVLGDRVQKYTQPYLDGKAIWYGHEVRLDLMLVALDLALALWFIAGATRLVRRELGHRDGPLGWTLFMAFAIVVMLGFRLPASIDAGGKGPAFGVSLALTYIALGGTAVVFPRLRRLINALRDGDRLWIWRELPPWVVGFAFTAMLGLVELAMREASGPRSIALIGFLLRDVAIVYALRLRYPARSDAAILMVAALLYGLGPYAALGIDEFRSVTMSHNWKLDFFISSSAADDWFGPLIPYAEAMLVMLLFGKEFARLLRRQTPAP